MATMVSSHDGQPHVVHLPLVLGDDGVLIGHLRGNNPYVEVLAAGAPTVAIFTGHHGYVSSSWYPAIGRDAAPTWNYTAVHCHGIPVLASDDAHTVRCVAALVEHLEGGRPNRWRMRELGVDGIRRRTPKIIGFEMPVHRTETRRMMSDHERPTDTAAAIAVLADVNPGLAQEMAEEHGLAMPNGRDSATVTSNGER
ncbi:PaiB family negative transcriptional regulator [Herbihabitans rhizosphaerae]|uniref:PaiB family negative transcriptional regulator n=2 Tax=Herbihabitans rhizosphaerae TaxID=1872711 RepID=A0A4Q7KX45_9PSEU|nr:PaiB family negative transcriptional regulator [Herbihabitans rhizosphaerae]